LSWISTPSIVSCLARVSAIAAMLLTHAPPRVLLHSRARGVPRSGGGGLLHRLARTFRPLDRERLRPGSLHLASALDAVCAGKRSRPAAEQLPRLSVRLQPHVEYLDPAPGVRAEPGHAADRGS